MGNAEIVIKSQEQVDALLDDFHGVLLVRGETAVVVKKRCHVIARDDSHVSAYSGCCVDAYDDSYVDAYDDSHVCAYDVSSVAAHDVCAITARGGSLISAQDGCRVEAYDSNHQDRNGKIVNSANVKNERLLKKRAKRRCAHSFRNGKWNRQVLILCCIR